MLKINFAPEGNTDITWLGIPIDPKFIKGVETHGPGSDPMFSLIIAENFREISDDGGVTLQNMIDNMQGAGIKITFQL